MGAYLEYCYVGTLEFAGPARRTMAEYATFMKDIGPEHCIMSSDLGNALNPVHTAGWKTYIEELLKAGITQQEIDWMAKRNPARLLGLD
jgi:predicted TIM-barrel fold metal-dependent hydrolase